MRKMLVLFVAVLFIFSFAYSAPVVQKQQVGLTDPVIAQPLQQDGQRIQDELDEIIWEEDFEGDNHWVFSDANVGEDIYWQTSDWEEFDNLNWRCFNEAYGNNGGYDNHWLQWMISPNIDLSQAEEATLRFQMRLVCEPAAGAAPPYDGWDTANVWASDDGGETWEVIEPTGGPDYNITSSYAFGDEWLMGAGIGGWGGTFDEWEEVEMDLSPFAGNNDVRIRFAFCSDPAASTADGTGPDWTGFQIDDVLVEHDDMVYYADNADGDNVGGPFLFASGLDANVGQSWDIYTVDDAPSPTHVAGIEDFELGYLHHYTYTEQIDLTDLDNGNTTLDLMMKGFWSHPNEFPNNAFWTMKVKPSDDDVWYYASNPYGLVPNTNYVYPSAPEEWQLFSATFATPWDLTPYHGQTIQLRLEFQSPIDPYDDPESYIYFDDIIVDNLAFEHDLGVTTPYIPFPLTVGVMNAAEVMFYNNGGSTDTGTALWYLNAAPTPFPEPEIVLEPGETITARLDADGNDGIDGWVPDEAGEADVYARIVLGNDDNLENNTSAHVLAEIFPEGLYEYGHDDRIPRFTTARFSAGEGPITHFMLPDDMPFFTVNTLRVMWNGDIEEGMEYDFNYHIFAGGEEPGEEIYSGTATATSEFTYPTFMEIDVSDAMELQNIAGDFWVWFELTDETAFPHIILSERNVGEGYHFEYDGVDFVDGDADWLIRVIGTEGEENPAHTLTIPIQSTYFELISFNVFPEVFDPPSVFEDIASLTIVYQNDGGIYLPPFINTIGMFDITQGYRVFCNEDETLVVNGELMDPTTVYSVAENTWNWVGYPYPYGVDVATALGVLENDIAIVLTDDGRLWIPPFLNTIGDMAEGEGYMIFAHTAMEFQYSDGMVARAGNSEVLEIPEVAGAPTATGLPYAVVVNINDNIASLDPAVIEVYDGNLLVGKSVVLDDQEMMPVIAWQGASDNGLSGFTPGHDIKVVIRDAAGQQLPINAKADHLFGEAAYATVSLEAATLPTEFTVSQGYPNPFNPSVTVPFALPARGDVKVAVYNVMGQQVFVSSQTFDAGFHRYVFDGKDLVSGVYFMNVSYQGQQKSQKLMLLK
ncbi:T9SS type A sorting domain-containing protein [bacterium]|nr:T9SS type A sorting domain-containing protein [bacterium]